MPSSCVNRSSLSSHSIFWHPLTHSFKTWNINGRGINMWERYINYIGAQCNSTILNWSAVDLQYYVSFRIIAKWFTCVCVCMYFRLFSIIVYCKIMNIVTYSVKSKSLSLVCLFEAPWTMVWQALLSMGRMLRVGSHALLQRIFLTQGSALALLLAGDFFTIWVTSFLCYTVNLCCLSILCIVVCICYTHMHTRTHTHTHLLKKKSLKCSTWMQSEKW